MGSYGGCGGCVCVGKDSLAKDSSPEEPVRGAVVREGLGEAASCTTAQTDKRGKEKMVLKKDDEKSTILFEDTIGKRTEKDGKTEKITD